MSRIIAVIPARMAATRFPGKPLALILGLPMIEHVRRRVALAEVLDEVVVATCDEAIATVVREAGGRVVMTGSYHERCMDRVAEAAAGSTADLVVNVQGDEPLVQPWMIEEVVRPLLEDASLPATNLVARIADMQEYENPNVPKVVTNRTGDLLYISREPIPSRRKSGSLEYAKWKQLGIIAFRSDFLRRFAKLEPTPLEQIESVDMLRAVEHGFRVRMIETSGTLIGVDVPEDIPRVEEVLKSDKLVRRYLGEVASMGSLKRGRVE